ncbi:type II toxin-antitoxin system PemK/MazF family toxin [Catellatospora sp. NPDC049609]|uniref:type II toxin-antitoxin system PemK/MazF family toxin n=1 Tax=Catellatospora sp. NPDC049609 TaxID=3155505 RepID=UPI00341913C1
MRAPVRGEVYLIDLGGELGRKPFAVISNNHRNRALSTVLAVRLTTTNRNTHLETVVPLGRDCGDLAGWVLCDDVEKLWRDELPAPAGALGPYTMAAVNAGLRAALAL